MSPRKARRPKLYDDPAGTRVDPGKLGYEIVQRPGRTFVRKQLSRVGARKHARLEALGELGYEEISTRGAGMLVHPSDPSKFWSIAAAAVHEGIDVDEDAGR
jgi:hypothetical protein